jgi:transposase
MNSYYSSQKKFVAINTGGGGTTITFLLAIIQFQWLLIANLVKELQETKAKARASKIVFGPKNEKSPKVTPTGKKRGGQKGHKGRGRKIPQGLKKEEVVVDFDKAPVCAICQTPYIKVTAFDKISHQIEMVWEAIHQVIRRVTYKKACKCSTGKKIITAPANPSVIKRSLLTTKTWVHLILMKYLLAVPVYRYLKATKSFSFHISPATVENGFKKIGILLEPIYLRMKEELLKADIWNADETRWKVFQEIIGKASFTWWLWVFASKNIVCYIIDSTRSSKVIEGIHDGSIRTIIADRWSAYTKMIKNGVIIAYCWVHLRRDFITLQKSYPQNPAIGVWVDDWLDKIALLYKLNNERLDPKCSEENFQKLRLQLCLIVDKLYHQEFQDNFNKTQTKILKSFKEKIVGYSRFIDNPEIPMDNNRAERLFKGPINGRKNYLGNVSIESIPHTQIILSIIATTKINQIDTSKWLSDYLSACAKNDSQPLSGEALEFHFKKLIASGHI